MKVADIKTEMGNKILEDLANQGWKTVREYSSLAFDKGIDFDSYTLKKGESKLEFKWNNWFEWDIVGTEDDIETIVKKYNLYAK